MSIEGRVDLEYGMATTDERKLNPMSEWRESLITFSHAQMFSNVFQSRR